MSVTQVSPPRRKRRGRRALIVLLVIVIVLVAGFFIADYFAKKYATGYVRDQVASSLGLPSTAPVTVDLGGTLAEFGGQLFCQGDHISTGPAHAALLICPDMNVEI